MKAIGESGAGAAALAAAGRKRKGQGYEEAYEVYKRATARSMDAFVRRAGLLGYTWPK